VSTRILRRYGPWIAAIPVVKIRFVLRLLTQDGWHLVATRGSRRQFVHPKNPGRVTVAGKDSDDLAQATFNSILQQAV
jgi:predicted RNA binding protein YcfA (HicA-like mRNA interferase family)